MKNRPFYIKTYGIRRKLYTRNICVLKACKASICVKNLEEQSD